MLKITKAKIELLTGINMVLMIETGIRNGLTRVIKKHSIANKKYLPYYDSTKKVYIYNIWTQITYMDGLCAKSTKKMLVLTKKLLVK